MYNLDPNFLINSGFFSEKTLGIKELLFDEGECDNNIYIIIKGFLSIEKYTTKERVGTKQLAIIKKGDFFGEASLNSDAPKEVKVKALSSVELLYINANKYDEFLLAHPREAKEMLVHLISITNKRVSQSNKYITSIYEINTSIRDIKAINFREIFTILDKINSIMNGDFLLFLEVNPVMQDYLSLKYDSRHIGKLQDIIVKKGDYSLEDIGINGNPKLLTKEISIGKEALGNIIIGRKNNFIENEKRIFLGMINSLAGVLKQKKLLEEERDREFAGS